MRQFGEALREFVLLRYSFEGYRNTAKELNYRTLPADDAATREWYLGKVRHAAYRMWMDFEQMDMEDEALQQAREIGGEG